MCTTLECIDRTALASMAIKGLQAMFVWQVQAARSRRLWKLRHAAFRGNYSTMLEEEVGTQAIAGPHEEVPQQIRAGGDIRVLTCPAGGHQGLLTALL